MVSGHTGTLRLLGGVRIVLGKSGNDRSVIIVGSSAHRHGHDWKEEDG
jgi:hypothetical protein